MCICLHEVIRTKRRSDLQSDLWVTVRNWYINEVVEMILITLLFCLKTTEDISKILSKTIVISYLNIKKTVDVLYAPDIR